jgi:hypothetical protein
MSTYYRFVSRWFKFVGIAAGTIAVLLVASSIADIIFGLRANLGWPGLAISGVVLGASFGLYKLGRFLEKELGLR